MSKQDSQFKPGQSGNPSGRPRGARNKATVAAEALLDGESEALTRRCIDLAMEGDPTALRLSMARILPVKRERTISLDLPALEGFQGALRAIGTVLEAGWYCGRSRRPRDRLWRRRWRPIGGHSRSRNWSTASKPWKHSSAPHAEGPPIQAGEAISSPEDRCAVGRH